MTRTGKAKEMGGESEQPGESMDPSYSDTDPLIGKVLNEKFRILGFVAAGGMGKIYRAEQQPLERIVAVKVLNPLYTHGADDNSKKRFFLEASVLARLQHPNIVTVFDYGELAGPDFRTFFMVMEYLPGETLEDRILARGCLSVIETYEIIRQIAKALREAHRQGVIHRDLKPSNIMLVPQDDGSELAKLLDFGLVKVLSDDSNNVTKEGSFLGSPRYMSPEQIAHGPLDLRTDIYSLGVIVFQCLCGSVPFNSDLAVHTLVDHLQSPVPRLKKLNPSIAVSFEVEAFVRRCLEKDPCNRPRNMDEFVHGFQTCVRASGIDLNFSNSGRFDIDSASLQSLREALVARRNAEIPPTLVPGSPNSATVSTLPPPENDDSSPSVVSSAIVMAKLSDTSSPKSKKSWVIVSALALFALIVVFLWFVRRVEQPKTPDLSQTLVASSAAPSVSTTVSAPVVVSLPLPAVSVVERSSELPEKRGKALSGKKEQKASELDAGPTDIRLIR